MLPKPTKIFHGWLMVIGCMAVAVVAWSFALYGPSVYLTALSQSHGWSLAVISSALTLSFLVNATVLSFVGNTIATYGPRPVMAAGATVMALGLGSLGQVSQLWQVYAAFACMGLGWSCLSTTSITATLAPWFDKHQGRAVSVAMLGASLGGIVGVPTLLTLIGSLGFSMAMLVVALILLTTVWPISFFIMRHRPQDLGLQPDGAQGQPTLQKTAARVWTRTEALQTRELRTVMLAFGLALLVQIGFLTHQVSLLLPAIGQTATAVCVTSAAVLSFGGRLLLARFSDRVDVRLIACGVLLQATLGLAIASIFSEQAWALIVGVLSYGMTAGNTTTLPPVIVRREFGAVSFGAIFGIAAMLIQIMSAMGPAFFGVLHDLSNGYQLPLGLAALLNVIAAVVILSGRRRL